MSKKTIAPMDPDELDLRESAKDLGFYGLVSRWDEVRDEAWLRDLILLEIEERSRRSVARRLRNARLSAFKSLADFRWNWPKKIDRPQVEALQRLHFLEDATNVLIVGPNGVGKTMIAKNIAYAAIESGKRVLFTTAVALLNDLGSRDTPRELERRLRRYANPDVLIIDEIGYLSCSADNADLLFEVITRRYERRSTVITTNKPFSQWGAVFNGAASVTVMVDRLIHHSEIVVIEGDSFRCHEAEERQKKTRRRKKKDDSSGEKEMDF